MSTYTTTNGDTFELISRKQYGTERDASLIQRANPGVFEPITAGTVLTIPPQPGAPQNQPQDAQSEQSNEVAVLIDGVRFRFWESIKLTQTIDAMSTVEFTTPFEPTAPGFKDTFRPFSFKPLTVTVGGKPLFTGTMVAPSPDLSATQKTLSVSGYALPAVLNDCTLPASAFPVEYNQLNLKDIAASVAGVFGLSVVFSDDPGPVFERVRLGTAEKALSFLSKLAKQRNFVITSTPNGELWFLRSVEPGQPVAILEQGKPPVESVTPTFNPQGYYSHLSGVVPTVSGAVGTQHTAKNPFPMESLRPLNFKLEDTENAAVKAAVDTKMGRMFGDMASYSLQAATWRDPNGVLWAPNTTLKLTAPGAMVYSSYEFIIRGVELGRDRASETATLALALPGAFSGKVPEALPWD